jgi:hypothetical protein
MEKHSERYIYSSHAFLWNGREQLSGTLEVQMTAVIFRFNNFDTSHLNLCIPIDQIERVEEFLVFDIAKIGLRIQGTNGKYDLFVLEDGQAFKKIVDAQIKKWG